MSGVPKDVLSYVKGKKFVTVGDLMERFGYKRATAYSYLSRLRKDGIVSRVGYGRYLVGEFKPRSFVVTPRVSRIVNVIRKKMPFVEFTIWSTENLAPFSHYAVGRDVVFLEADRRTSKKIREVLLEDGIRSLTEPSRGQLNDVFSLLEEPVVIFQRKEAYATRMENRVRLPSLERMLVDLYFYITRFGFPYPPGEYGRLLYNVLKSVTLNIDMLKRYASRRGVREEISLLLSGMRDRYPELDIPEPGERPPEADEMLAEMVRGAAP
jgi:DNA-binding transcriptional ArsR family regulator